MINGIWTYRSYRNDTALIGADASAALALIFGEGVFDLNVDDEARISGMLDMGDGYALTLSGTIDPGSADETFDIVGLGIDGTPTAGWRYDYRGMAGAMWPNAVAQVPCLLGTVIRVKPHGANAPAGVTASFVCVRRSDAPSLDATTYDPLHP